MSTRVASILAEIGIDSSKFASGASMINGDIGKIISNLGKIGAAAVGFDLLVKGLKFAVGKAIEAEQATAKLNQVLESTQDVSGMTIESLDGIASSLAKVTVYDDNAIKSAEALLLTFTKVGKDVFPQAMEAALNMSTAFGQDLQGSVIQLGKALNDPSGMAAMKRIGVSFTDAQMAMGRAMFETGDIAGYQKLIMSELNTEVGGMAKAMGTTYAGQVAILKNNFGELGETVGSWLIPWLAGAAAGANTLFTRIEMLQTSASKWGDQLRSQGVSYEDYVKKIIANADALGVLHYSQEAYLNMIAEGKELPGQLADKIGLLSEREYALLLYQNDLTTSTKTLSTQMGHLGVEANDLSGTVGPSGLGKALSNTTAYFKALTTEVLFNMAAEGLDAEAALALASGMGLVDSAAMAEITAMQLLRDEYDDTGDLETYIELTSSLGAKLAYIAANSKIDIVINTTGTSSMDYVDYSQGYYNSTGQWVNKGPGGATGMDFIVPPGYQNDSFPMRVQSGEHVQVTPAGEMQKQSSGGYGGPSAKEIGKEAGEAMAIKLMQLGLV